MLVLGGKQGNVGVFNKKSNCSPAIFNSTEICLASANIASEGILFPNQLYAAS